MICIKLIIAEKPSVAQTIANVLGVTDRQDGYFSSDEYTISWCLGHLVGSAYPQSYDEKYKKWSLEDLPIIPDHWLYTVSKDKQKQFTILKKLLHDPAVDEVINACDSGREGELIFKLVYHQAFNGVVDGTHLQPPHCGSAKPIKRLWTSSLESETIKKALENLRSDEEMETLYQSAMARDKADWLVGINLSRILSLVYQGNLSVGRVKTPTLAMITERNTDISLFQKETRYGVALELRKEGVADSFTVSSEKFRDKETAQALLEKCKGKEVKILSLMEESKRATPPKLYDLTTLQRECNRLFKYTAQQTLDIVQSLYENKLITYPRTDSNYLTEDMEESTLEVIERILQRDLFSKKIVLAEKPNLKPCINNAKVSDHFAIIPTKNIATVELFALSMEERQVLTLIAGKLLCATSPTYLYNQMNISVLCEDTLFTATGNIILRKGFKEIEEIVFKQKGETQEKNIFYTLRETDSLMVSKHFIKSYTTKPPKPFTEDTLLSAMERAGNKDTADGVEKKGIGTPATRANIIEGLVKDGYITRAKNEITPTPLGMNVITVVPDEIRSPKLTADWEEKLLHIEQGHLTATAFLEEIETLIRELYRRYEGIKDTVDTSAFSSREVIGVCPRCQSDVFFGGKHKNYYCANKDCDFALWENNKFFASLGAKITKRMVKDFLENGETYVEGLKSKKGNHFGAFFVLKDTGKYINFDMRFK